MTGRLFVFLLLVCLTGCGARIARQEAERTTAEALDSLTGRQIRFVHRNRYRIDGQNVLWNSQGEELCRIITFSVPDQCNDCSLRLGEWKLKMKELAYRGWVVPVIFIIQSDDYASFEHYSRELLPDYPFIYDTTGHFLKANALPTNIMYHTFLVDHNNRIVLIGSPLGNEQMWELYKSTIARLVDSGGTLTDRETSITRK